MSSNVSTLSSAISSEVSDRQTAISGVYSDLSSNVSTLNSLISTEVSDRQTAISGVYSDLSSNVSTLSSEITSLQSLTSVHTANISDLTSRLVTAETELSAIDLTQASVQITELYSDIAVLEGNVSTLQTDIDALESNVQALSTDATDRILTLENSNVVIYSRLSTVESDLSQEITDRQNAISTLETTINDTISSQIESISLDLSNLQTSVNSTISGQISNVTAQVTQEITDRQTAITGVYSALSSNVSAINSNVSTVSSGLSSEITDRQTAISGVYSALSSNVSAINSNVSTVSSGLSSEITARQTAVTGVYSALSSNVSAINSNVTTLSNTVSSNYSTLNSSKVDKVGDASITGNLSVSKYVTSMLGVSVGNSSVYTSFLNGSLQLSDGSGNVMTITPTTIQVSGNVTSSTQFTPIQAPTLPSPYQSGKYLTNDGVNLSWGSITGGSSVSFVDTIELSPSLLAHFNGTFADSSSSNLSVTNTGGLIDSTNKKFGSGSWYANASINSRCTYSSLALGVQDFTIEFWAYRTTNLTSEENLFCVTSGAAGLNVSWTNTEFVTFVAGINIIRVTNSVNARNNTWWHFAITRKGHIFRAFVNGSLIASAGSTSNITTGIFNLGNSVSNNGGWKGWIDELQVTVGSCKYVENFTPRDSEFTGVSTIPTSGSVGQIITDGNQTYVCSSASPITWKKLT
ncbi:MAG: hypothetical protein EBU90_18810 [Proteobacteria bacterium]|nr:hypothetical protein [Pseudomonadota bacterium]